MVDKCPQRYSYPNLPDMLDGTKGLYGDGYERVLREMALDDPNGASCQPQGTAGRRQEVGGTESQSPKLIVVSDSDGHRKL